MNEETKPISEFDYEEICLLTTFMRSDNKERIIKQLDEIESDDSAIYSLRDSIKVKIESMSQENIRALLSALPPNEFSGELDAEEEVLLFNEKWK